MNARWVARVAASAAIRKVVYIAIAAIVAFLSIGQARAECGLPEHTVIGNGNFQEQGEAYLACMKNPATVTERIGSTSTYYEMKIASCELIDPQLGNKWVPRYNSTHRYTKNVNNGECTLAPGSSYTRTLGSGYSFTTMCSARAARYGGWMKAGSIVCDAGCQMTPAPAAAAKETDDVKIGNSITSLLRTNWVPTGGGCSATPITPAIGPPEGNYCLDLPMGHKICKDTQGRNCVVSGKTGRKYCPTDGAPSVSPDRTEGATNAPGDAPGNKPSPRQGEEWVDGPGATTTNSQGSGCTSNCGNTTNTTTVVGNSGRPNTNPGDGTPGDGSDNPGEPGDGDDKDPGEASGGGTCDVAPTCTGKPVECAILQQQWMARCENKSGDAGDALGTLYEGSDRTVGDAFGDFQTRIGDAPLIDAGGQFFSVSAGGSCPVFSVPATEFWEPLTFDYHCSGDLNSFLLLGGYLVLAVAAFAAFKIAVY